MKGYQSHKVFNFNPLLSSTFYVLLLYLRMYGCLLSMIYFIGLIKAFSGLAYLALTLRNIFSHLISSI
ncbi:hypothetical protein BX661DRAFT_34167 [Kickxella alabastrina]|uniref:uncharacterized protein n=1 Tax=Kickxella alabastrina TaxID=61397 RepID=UPI00221E829F|nr:uncharacterized protein BX661DRAFT_34167 [Kickxella alabastrina]KAI7818256.1 hypothetical protein BX661DRAFT_34167 [Kickxella alabastrina]